MEHLSTRFLQTTDVRRRITTLALWFNGVGEAHRIDGIARAALAHVWFETIHPFEGGNGRIGRAISDKVLAQDMKRSPRLLRVSQQMWLDREGYYAQLQAVTGKANLDVTPWLMWFVGCVEKAGLASAAHMQTAANRANNSDAST